ncbi:reverse transcriptase domain-containing protein [Tanacetum coccineum]
MRTRSQSRNPNLPQQEASPVIVEPLRIEYPVQDQPQEIQADNRTMAQLLEAPTEGYEDAIVVPEITANNFEIKHGLLNLVQNKQFFGHDKEDPHAHIRYFNKITSTMKFPNVPSTSVKLLLFPFSLEGAARIWLEKEPPRSIVTWDDLVSKFINKFFPPSKTTNLRNEITRFQQKFDETFYEAWDRFNDLLRACPHHGFSELHQLDTFYNALNTNDQDSLNSAAGGNFLDKMPRECLKIIESKSKVRQSRSKAVIAKVDKKNQAPAPVPAPVKAIEASCVTCGGAHSYQQCPANGEHVPIIFHAYVSQARRVRAKRTNQMMGNDKINWQYCHLLSKMVVQTASTSGSGSLRTKDVTPVCKSISKSKSQADVESVSAPKDVTPFPSRRNDETIDLSLRSLPQTCMTLELSGTFNHYTNRIAIDVRVVGGKFPIPAGVCGVEFDARPSSTANSGRYGIFSVFEFLLLLISSPTLTHLEKWPFYFEEANAFLALDDVTNFTEVDPTYYDPDGEHSHPTKHS